MPTIEDIVTDGGGGARLLAVQPLAGWCRGNSGLDMRPDSKFRDFIVLSYYSALFVLIVSLIGIIHGYFVLFGPVFTTPNCVSFFSR